MDFPVILAKDDMACMLKECVLAGYLVETRKPLRVHREENRIDQLQPVQADMWRMAYGLRDILISDDGRVVEYWLLQSTSEWGRVWTSDGISS